MPVVSKQSKNDKAVKPVSMSVLSRIQPVRSKQGRLKCSFYGQPKTGKTRLACTFPKPLLVIGAEDGTASIVGAKDVSFIRLENTDEIQEIVEDSILQEKWRSVVLDNATDLREMRIRELFAAMGMDVPERKPFLYADKIWKTVWNQCSQDMKKLLGKLLDAPRQVEVNVSVIAHEQDFTPEDSGQTDSSLMIQPKVGSALGKGLCNWLNGECDYVCQTFIRERVVESEITIAGKKQTQKKRTGKMEFCLRTGPHELYLTGFRQSLGCKELPDVIVDPSYEKMLAVIEGRKLP